MIFFTSDTHLFHDNAAVYGPRGFDNARDHTEAIRDNWNSTVGPHDVVFCLGDMVLGHRRDNLPFLNTMNGIKVLVPGNHDNVSSLHKNREKWMNDYLGVFLAIFDENVVSGETAMSHYPPAEIPDHGEEDRYPHLRPALSDDIRVHLHGHTHYSDKVRTLSNGSLAVHVGMDAWGLKPVSVDVIEAITGGNLRDDVAAYALILAGL